MQRRGERRRHDGEPAEHTVGDGTTGRYPGSYDGEMETVYDWLREHGAAGSYRVGSLRQLASSVSEGEDFRFVLREFLDDVNLVAATRPQDLVTLVAERPEALDHAGQHAFLGGLAEHLAMIFGLERPRWSVAPDRFLQAWWFPAENPAYDAVAIRESPPAFRRRGIFLPASMLERV